MWEKVFRSYIKIQENLKDKKFHFHESLRLQKQDFFIRKLQ